MIDMDQFEERAGTLQFDDGLSKWKAETESAKRLGFRSLADFRRAHADSQRNSDGGGDIGSSPERDTASDLPGLQSAPKKENRSMPVSDVQA